MRRGTIRIQFRLKLVPRYVFISILFLFLFVLLSHLLLLH